MLWGLAIIGVGCLALGGWLLVARLAYSLSDDRSLGAVWLDKRMRARGANPARIPVGLRRSAVDLAAAATFSSRRRRADPAEFRDYLDHLAAALIAGETGVAQGALAHSYRAIQDHAARLTIAGQSE